MKKNFVLIFFLLCVIGCSPINNNSKNKSRLDSEKNVDTISNNYTIQKDSSILSSEDGKNKIVSNDLSITCDSLLTLIVNSSDIDKKRIKGFKISKDQFENEIITVKISNRNEENIDVPIAWLEVDLKNKELRDVTFDPDSPIILNCNKKYFKSLTEVCK